MTSIIKKSQKKAEKKANHEHVLTKLFKDEVGDNIDLIIRPTCLNRDIHALSLEPKSFLQQMNNVHEDGMLVLQQHEVGLTRTLTLHVFDHLDSEVTSSFRCT